MQIIMKRVESLQTLKKENFFRLPHIVRFREQSITISFSVFFIQKFRVSNFVFQFQEEVVEIAAGWMARISRIHQIL